MVKELWLSEMKSQWRIFRKEVMRSDEFKRMTVAGVQNIVKEGVEKGGRQETS